MTKLSEMNSDEREAFNQKGKKISAMFEAHKKKLNSRVNQYQGESANGYFSINILTKNDFIASLSSTLPGGLSNMFVQCVVQYFKGETFYPPIRSDVFFLHHFLSKISSTSPKDRAFTKNALEGSKLSDPRSMAHFLMASNGDSDIMSSDFNHFFEKSFSAIFAGSLKSLAGPPALSSPVVSHGAFGGDNIHDLILRIAFHGHRPEENISFLIDKLVALLSTDDHKKNNLFTYITENAIANFMENASSYVNSLGNKKINIKIKKDGLIHDSTDGEKEHYQKTIFDFLIFFESVCGYSLKKSFEIKGYRFLRTDGLGVERNEIIKKIMRGGEVDGPSSTASHFVQGAYLHAILGENVKIQPSSSDGTDIYRQKFNPKNTKNGINPFTRIGFFYGSTEEILVIEKKLSIVEGGTPLYIENFTRNRHGLDGQSMIFDRFFLIFNYVRSLNFIFDMQRGYNEFKKTNLQKTFSAGHSEKFFDEAIRSPEMMDPGYFLKKIQTSIILCFVDHFDAFKNAAIDDNSNLLADILFSSVYESAINSARCFFQTSAEYSFLDLVVSKILFFLRPGFSCSTQEINNIEGFTSCLSIFKQGNEHFDLFSATQATHAYFPIGRSSVVIFFKTETEPPTLNEKCMLDLQDIPFVVS